MRRKQTESPADEAPLLNAQRTEDELRRLEEAKKANQERNNERLERLNAIANQADERKREIDGLDDIEDDEPTKWSDPDEEEQAAPQAAESSEPEQQPENEDVRVTNGETYYRIVVNGQEKWLTLKQLRDTSSKVTAADEYLRNAKQALNNMPTAAPSVDEPPSPDKGRVRDVLHRALMGEADAIEELARRLESAPSENDVLRAVDGRIDGRLTFRQAVDWFETEYADVLKIDELRQFAVAVDARLAQENPEGDFKERLRQVGESTRQRAKALRQALLGTVDEQVRNQKEARKASVRPVPTAGQRQAEPGDEEDDETYESAIAKMASARGQSRPIIHRR